MDRPWLKFYDEGVPHALEPSDKTVPDFLRWAAENYPRHTATAFMGARLTYRDLLDKVQRLASALRRFGINKGDRVAIILPNSPQLVIAYYATLWLGGVTVLTNPLYVERELEYQWGDAGIKVIITLDLLFPKVEAVGQKLGVNQIIVTGVQDFLPIAKKLLLPLQLRRQGRWVDIDYNHMVSAFKDLVNRREEPHPLVSVSPDDLACLQYTGGTTGLPKGAMLTHRNLVASVRQVRQFLLQGHTEATDKAVVILPIFHVYGMVIMNLGMHLAATLVLLPRFEAKSLVEAIKNERPTFFLGVPALYVAILNYPGIDEVDLTSIKVCFSGGAPLPVEVIEEFERRTTSRIAEAYGMTETASVTHVNPRQGQRKYGSVGVPLVGTDAKIVDATDGAIELGFNEPGELLIKGPQVMQGYWNRSEETAQTLTEDDWLHSGDIATMDEEGYFTIVDRKKDLILSAGFNVYPREVEEVLYQHPSVEHAAVIGIPHKVRGEKITAYIQLKDGKTATAAEIRQFCKERLADYKVPRSVVFKDKLPISMAGKVLRRILRDEELTK
jgi:long-chain acyl-CoA synthetase